MFSSSLAALPRLRVAAAALVLCVAGAALPLGCGTEEGEPLAVAVRYLAAAPEAYEGREVITSGVVRVFYPGEADEHYVVEDPQRHRVGLALDDTARLAELVGRSVTVTGVLHFREDRGVFLDVRQLEPQPSPTPVR